MSITAITAKDFESSGEVVMEIGEWKVWIVERGDELWEYLVVSGEIPDKDILGGGAYDDAIDGGEFYVDPSMGTLEKLEEMYVFIEGIIDEM